MKRDKAVGSGLAVPLLILAALAAGCGSVEMKGSPFYTGDYSKPLGPPEERVNFWPVAYYHDPVLSILWPIFETTDDHVAVRPVFSVYNLDKDKPVWNVLWPLIQFDTAEHTNRIFPFFFWGGDNAYSQYFVVFPLYWHYGAPYLGDSDGTKNGSDALFPLWIYYHDSGGYDLHVLWPIFRLENDSGGTGWRVWPLVGSYWQADWYERYILWPFGRQWNTAGGEAGWRFWPLVGSWWDANSYTRYALWPLAWQWRDGKTDAGHCIIPFYYFQREGESSRFFSLPWWTEWSASGTWQLAPPFYYHQWTQTSDSLLTPLYAQGESDGGKTKWYTVIPLWYHRSTPDSELVATLLGWTEKDAKTRNWTFFPLLSGGRRDDTSGNYWFLAPLIHSQWDATGSEHHVLPFYYWNGWTDTFLSLLACRWKGDEGTTNTLIPLALSWLTSGEKRSDLHVLGPLAHLSWGEKAGSSYVFPLYYKDPERFYTPLFGWNDRKDGFTYVTPIAGVYKGKSSGAWLLPLFSYRVTQRTKAEYTRCTFLFWGKHVSHEGKTESHWFPLYSYTNHGPIEPAWSKPKNLGLRGKKMNVLLLAWYKNMVNRWVDGTGAVKAKAEYSSGIFPFWSRGGREHDGGVRSREWRNVLWFLYDYKHIVKPGKTPDKKVDYERSSILWRVWHYEKLNGDVSVDAFPAITWDSKKSGYSKFSFLWRFVGYESDPAKGKRLDLLFIPFRWGAPAKPATAPTAKAG